MAGDNLDTEYLQFRRYSQGAGAGDRLLQELGLDDTGQPLQKTTPGGTGTPGAAPTQQPIQAGATLPTAKQGAGFITETGRAVIGGATDAIRQMIQTSGDIASWIEEKTGIPKGGAVADAIKDALPVIPENESTVGGMARGITQFLAGYLTGGKALGTAKAGAKLGPMIAGAFSDIAAFDPNDPNLSNLLEQLNPGLKDSIVTFLATDPNDSGAENRLKRAIEGAGLGVATDLVFRVAKHWRAARKVKAVEDAFEQAKQGPTAATTPAARPSAGSQIDVVKPAGQDIGVGVTGREAVLQGERLALPAPGQAVLTADEIADNAIREAKARAMLEGNPTLAAAQKTMTALDDVRGNQTLRAAQETLIRGQSEEAMIKELVSKERGTLEAIIGDESGRAAPDAIYALGRTAVGAAIGLSQGETMEDRITNALVLGGVAAAVKPASVKKLIKALADKFPREMKVIQSFDPPTLKVSGKGAPAARRLAVKPVEVASDARAKEFLAANPDAIDVGDKAIKINWSEIGDQKEIDDVIKTLTALNKESIDVARRGVQSDEKRRMLADMLGVTEDDMLRRRRGQALNAEQTQAFVDLYGSATRELDRLATMVKSGEPVGAQFRAHLGKTTALTHEIFGARAEAGRALRVWGQAAQEITAGRQLDALTIAGKGSDDVPIERLADMVLELKDGAQKATFLRQATTLGRGALLEAWINGLLTNPATHMANIVSNSIVTANALIERQIAGMLGKQIARGEAGAMVHGLSTGWLDALHLARRAFMSGESQLGFTKLDLPRTNAISAENLMLSGPVGRAVDLVGQLVRIPGRALVAADDFFKAINYRMELHAQAYRQAFKEGGTDAGIAKRMGELLADDDFISLAKDTAEGAANYQTFNQQLGKFGSAYLNLADDHPMLRIVTPFIRTPVNIAKYTLERTPILNLAMKQVREDMAAGGMRRDMALAKMAYGGMMFTAATTLAAAGLITGGGPRDPDLRNMKRATGWQPDSFKIGGKWVSYSRTDPLGAFLGMAARFVELSGEADEMDLDTAAMAMVLAFKDVFINKTYAQGIFDAFEAITTPDRSWQNYYEKLGGSVVPAGVAQLERTFDPTLREADGLLETIMSRIPGLSSTLEPRLNIWGEPIVLEGGVGPDLVSPFYTSAQKKDPVSEEMLRLELSIGMPPRHVFGTRPSSGVFADNDPGEGVELFPEEYSRFVKLSAGQGLDGTSKTLKEALGDIIDSESYQRQSDLVKGQMLQRVVGKYREAAQGQLLKEFDDLRESVVERIEVRKEARRPTGGLEMTP